MIFVEIVLEPDPLKFNLLFLLPREFEVHVPLTVSLQRVLLKILLSGQTRCEPRLSRMVRVESFVYVLGIAAFSNSFHVTSLVAPDAVFAA